MRKYPKSESLEKLFVNVSDGIGHDDVTWVNHAYVALEEIKRRVDIVLEAIEEVGNTGGNSMCALTALSDAAEALR